ncbi:hypothetical protein ZWY2020_047803 [Hordeum vulgare]|nr:hypothetical protein ZWY2020_047803 [Hordeum vulgare]
MPSVGSPSPNAPARAAVHASSHAESLRTPLHLPIPLPHSLRQIPSMCLHHRRESSAPTGEPTVDGRERDWGCATSASAWETPRRARPGGGGGGGSKEVCSARGGCGPTEIQVVSAASRETTGQLISGDLMLDISPSLLHVSLAYEHDGEVDSVWEQIGTKSRENREWGDKIAVIVGCVNYLHSSAFVQIGGVTGLALAATLFLGFGYLTLLFTDDPAVLDIAIRVRRGTADQGRASAGRSTHAHGSPGQPTRMAEEPEQSRLAPEFIRQAIQPFAHW